MSSSSRLGCVLSPELSGSLSRRTCSRLASHYHQHLGRNAVCQAGQPVRRPCLCWQLWDCCRCWPGIHRRRWGRRSSRPPRVAVGYRCNLPTSPSAWPRPETLRRRDSRCWDLVTRVAGRVPDGHRRHRKHRACGSWRQTSWSARKIRCVSSRRHHLCFSRVLGAEAARRSRDSFLPDLLIIFLVCRRLVVELSVCQSSGGSPQRGVTRMAFLAFTRNRGRVVQPTHTETQARLPCELSC